ncbi:hypothetical protein KVT40_008477 [Elsinoe batatas]|uniref:Uncharacterized protein n=1 Tax=Elsinoe batatas TaxID=2601811 RepID=A0A8K0KT92_9PEZI|nr:hypothetical protein KVT40_008477 [Elsinoe batatas]
MMFATALRAAPRGVPASVATKRITGMQQAGLATIAIAAPAGILLGAPKWAPRAGDRADRFFERMAERMEKMPKMKRPTGLRITIPRIGSVGL